MGYKTVLVTGATGGIGYALVKTLTDQRYQVFASGRDQATLTSLMVETGCSGQVADLSIPDEVIDLYRTASEELGQVDVLINNAGFNSRKCELIDTSLDEFESQYAVNLRAPYLLCREAMKEMRPRGSGYILNVISTVAKRTNATMSIYTAMKEGLAGLNNVLMKEAQPHGIRVTALYPGGTNTGFRKEERPQYMSSASVGDLIAQLLITPPDVVVHEMTFRPPVELE